jgi:hypothetical protein
MADRLTTSYAERFRVKCPYKIDTVNSLDAQPSKINSPPLAFAFP